MEAETKNFIKEEIESLAIIIAKAFDSQQKSIETVQQELTLEIQDVKEYLTTVEGKLGTVEGKLGAVEGKLGAVEGKLGAVEGRLGTVEGRLTTVEAKIDRETEMLVVMENALMDRDLAGEDRTQQVLQRVERIEDHLKLSHSLEPA